MFMSKTTPQHLLPIRERLRLRLPWREQISKKMGQFGRWLQQYWFRLLVIGLLTFILLRKDLTFQLSLKNSVAFWPQPTPETPAQPQALPTSLSAKAELTPEQLRQLAYVERFAEVAQTEMRKFGIPASITLAQGLLETQAGESPLATEFNNHFGMKCFSRSCEKGHCSNFTDDSHKDFFRIYDTAWESYRAHSLLLKKSERYQPLFELPADDYKAWAKGLKKAGYATDRRYADKLIGLIEELRLQQFDR